MRAIFLADGNIFTTGFSRMSERQLALWNPVRAQPGALGSSHPCPAPTNPALQPWNRGMGWVGWGIKANPVPVHGQGHLPRAQPCPNWPWDGAATASLGPSSSGLHHPQREEFLPKFIVYILEVIPTPSAACSCFHDFGCVVTQ